MAVSAIAILLMRILRSVSQSLRTFSRFSMEVVMEHLREHRSLLAAGEKRLLIALARQLPRWINSDHLSLLGLLSMAAAGLAFAHISEAWGSPALSLALLANSVRRQPRRHAGAGPRSAAAALRLLRRSRDRPRLRRGAARRHGRIRPDRARDCPRRPRGVPARVRRNLSGHAFRRCLSALVRRPRTDRAAHPAGGRRLVRRGASVGVRRRPSGAADGHQRRDPATGAGPCSFPA